MNVAILGAEQPSQLVAQIIEQNYNIWLEQKLGEKLNVVAFVSGGGGISTPNVGNVPVLNTVQFALLYHKKVIDKIIFPRERGKDGYEWHLGFLSMFKNMNVKLDDIYIASRLNNSINALNFLESYMSADFLPYLEFMIADHCNLNCKSCALYSGLVKEPHFPVFEKFTRDLEKLHEYISDIDTIRILGGEPLLNPEINEYIKLTRRIYPFADIYIVTNAILLPKMPDTFFDTLRSCNVKIFISTYLPMKNKQSEIQNLLINKNVGFRIMPNVIEKFSINQTLKPNSDKTEMFSYCSEKVCNSIRDGKIAACGRTFMTKYFNEYFNANLPQDGILDLYEDNLTVEKIKKHLITPFERCRYCIKPHSIKWSTIKYPSQLSDWVVDYPVAN